jgi:hypothetical protein
VKLGLQDVATAMGDIDAYIAQSTPEQQRFPRIATGIARQLLAVGRPQDALAFLNRATPDGRWRDQHPGHRHAAADGQAGHRCAGAGRRRCAPGATGGGKGSGSGNAAAWATAAAEGLTGLASAAAALGLPATPC